MMCARVLEQTNPEKALTYYNYSSSLMSHAINKLVKLKSVLNSESPMLCNGYLHVIGLQCSAIISRKLFSMKRLNLGNSYSIMEELFQKNKSGEGRSRSKSAIKFYGASDLMNLNSSPSSISSSSAPFTNFRTSSYSSSSVFPNNKESMYDLSKQIKFHHSHHHTH